jgi:DNA-binding transcriptional LysR family regulator
MPDINWNALYGFWLTAEHRSFADASRDLPRGSAQALHKRVRALEGQENLNLKLLRSRGVKGVELTEAGRRVYELVDPVFRDFDRLIAELRGEGGGRLEIAATAFSSNHYVPAMIAAFGPMFPQVSVHLQMCESAEVIGLVESGAVDFGICAPFSGKPDGSEVKASTSLRTEIIAPLRHPLAGKSFQWADVVREPLVLPTRTSVLRQAFDELMRRENLSARVRVRAELTTPELSVEAVRAGFGIALIAVGPRLGKDLHGLWRTSPPPGLPNLEVGISCRTDRYLPRYMQCFLAIATEVLHRKP